MLTRRELIRNAAALGASAAMPFTALTRRARAGAAPATQPATQPAGVFVNDVQSQLNATRVARVVRPDSLDAIAAALGEAKRAGQPVSVSGGRHAMGGQQFAEGALHLDMTGFGKVLSFDREKGLIEVEAGIEWPELLAYLHREQAQVPVGKAWSIRQKQTGVDRVTLAGSLASNGHGRGLKFSPLVADVESFVLVDASGKPLSCSRKENAELFSLAIGGYGLFGVIASVKLRLVPRVKIQRTVKVIAVRDLLTGVEERLQEGYVYGDCQYATDFEANPDAPHRGVFSCYKPVPPETPIPEDAQKKLTEKDWEKLYYLAHKDKKAVFEAYAGYYLGTSGQIYWSDTHQLGMSNARYHEALDLQLNSPHKGSEMITEVYVKKENLLPFMVEAKNVVREKKIDLIYGTIRFIEKDADTFLAWAKEPSVCVLCNVHVTHSEEGLRTAADHLRSLIDVALHHGGRYFLTYHRWATRPQVEQAYPQFVDYLKLKKKYDPQERFQSNWYRHYREMFADRL